MKAVFSRRAESDLSEIWHYIAEDNIDAADRVVVSIRENVILLSKTPKMGRSRDEIHRGLRSFPAGNYIIFYMESKEVVEIVRVLHGARDIGIEQISMK